MNKKISILLVLALIAAMFAGCQSCEHEWADATCEEPKTCELCDETEGEALGHSWLDATCEEPKTCEECDETEGEALGHTWEEATTEAPKTCTVCQITEGEPLAKYENEESKALQGKWYTEMTGGAEEMGLEGFEGRLGFGITMEFGEAGEFAMGIEVMNWEEFKQDLFDYMKVMIIAEYEEMGITTEAADEALLAAYGVTLDQYIQMTVDAFDVSALLGEFDMEMVYYAEDGKLYLGDDWDSILEGSAYTLENGVLIIEDLYGLDGVTPMEWTRVEE